MDGAGFPVEEESHDHPVAPSLPPRPPSPSPSKEALVTLNLVEQVLQEIARLVKREYG
jgi:hypothetical protein